MNNDMNNFDFITEYRYINGTNGNVIGKHRHPERVFPFCVAVYVKKGKYFVEMHNKRYDISEEETVFIPSFVTHTVGSDSEVTVTYVHFVCNYMNFDVFSLSENECLRIKNKNLCTMLEEINSAAAMGGIAGKIGTDKAICDVVSFLIKEKTLNVSETSVDPQLMKILNYIKENAWKGITVEEIIEVSGYGKTRFYEFFSDNMNMTPHNYIEKERMRKTLLLLAEGKKVKDAAAVAGYYDEIYFTKKFKKIFNMTPRQYKRRLKEQWSEY